MSTVPPSVVPPTRNRSSTQTPSSGPYAPPLNLSSQAVAAPPAAAAKPTAVSPEIISSDVALENGEHCHLPSPMPQQPPHSDPAVEQLIQHFFPRRANPAHPWAGHGDTIRYLLSYYEYVDLAVLSRVHESQRSSAKLLTEAINKHVCKGRTYTALYDTVAEFFSEAQKQASRKRSVTEVDEDQLASCATKRSATEMEEDAGTPAYAPKE